VIDKYTFFNGSNGQKNRIMMTIPEPKSPFKTQDFNPATLKAASNAALEDAMYKFSTNPNDVFDGMQ
jgi:hypothetical protein